MSGRRFRHIDLTELANQLTVVQVYRNLHHRCWSIRARGRVIGHAYDLCLRDPTFHVQPAGRRRVLLSGMKNVHAYVKGTAAHYPNVVGTSAERRIRYNPRTMGSFELDGLRGDLPVPIRELAGVVNFRQGGSVWLVS